MKTLRTVILGITLFMIGMEYTAAEKIPSNAKKLIRHYKECIAGYADNHILFKDGSKMLWDDGIKDKSFQELLDKPDIEDMFFDKYNRGKVKLPIRTNYDPGRIRNEPFFLKIYGSSDVVVKENLREIVWCPKLVGKTIKVSTLYGVDKKFEKISRALDEHPEYAPYISKIAGTFNWRKIAGTDRLSMHSFGMTMDINTSFSHYWQWDCECKNEDVQLGYMNKIPQGLVDIFEKNGFIWGGKWYHYDTMHFEFRPELL